VVSGRRFDVRVVGPPPQHPPAAVNGTAAAPRQAPRRSERKEAAGGGPDVLASPLQGNVWKVLVKQGDTVEEGQLLVIIEAMKMENEITAHKAGTVVELAIEEGAPIQAGAPIATIKASEGE
jgi:acetyl-CoA/propionyl-CoA carboxylase biotin carboxyl carrier protein